MIHQSTKFEVSISKLYEEDKKGDTKCRKRKLIGNSIIPYRED